MQGKIRQLFVNPPSQSQILHNQGIHPRPIQESGVFHRLFHFLIENQGVHGHEHLHASGVGVVQGLLHPFIVKISRIHPGVEQAAAHIDGIRPVLHRRNQRLHTSGRNQQLRFSSLLHSILLCFYSSFISFTQVQKSFGQSIIRSAWYFSSSSRGRNPQVTPTVYTPAFFPVIISVLVSPK